MRALSPRVLYANVQERKGDKEERMRGRKKRREGGREEKKKGGKIRKGRESKPEIHSAAFGKVFSLFFLTSKYSFCFRKLLKTAHSGNHLQHCFLSKDPKHASF